jgi:hypothetical protein
LPAIFPNSSSWKAIPAGTAKFGTYHTLAYAELMLNVSVNLLSDTFLMTTGVLGNNQPNPSAFFKLIRHSGYLISKDIAYCAT